MGVYKCMSAWMCDVHGNTTIQRNDLLFSLVGYYFLSLNVAQLTHVRLHQQIRPSARNSNFPGTPFFFADLPSANRKVGVNLLVAEF